MALLPNSVFAYIAGVSSQAKVESKAVSIKKPIGLLCNSSAWGGLEMNVLSLAHRMHERHWPVVIYGRSDSTLAEHARAEGIRFSHLRSQFKFGDILNARRLARAMADDGIEVLINNLNRDIFLSVLAKRFMRKPLRLLYYQHMQLGVDKRDRFHTWLYGNLDGWIAPLPGFVASLESRTKLDINKAHVIPFGIDIQRFTSSSSREDTMRQARQELALPQDALIVGVVGRLDPKKGQHTLIEALAVLKDEHPNLHILILGDKTHGEAAGYERRLQQLTRELGLSERVHFRPHRVEVETAYGALDIFTLTSESETYGMVTLEAMASGVPVIGTNAGGTRELIEDGVSGLLYDYEDTAGLANCLKRLINDTDLSSTLSKSAGAKIQEGFSYQRQCQLLERLIDKL